MKRNDFIRLCVLILLSVGGNAQNNTLKLGSGEVVRLDNFNSEYVSPRNIDVWLPDHYTEEKKYAVLYMHDGQMLYDSTTTWNKQEWSMDETAGRLLEDEEIMDVIVVGIWNTEYRHSEYFPQKPFERLPERFRDSLLNQGGREQGNQLFRKEVCSDNYLKFIVQELKPQIDKRFSTKADRNNTFIMGSSMGGLISMYALCEYPEVFYGAACLSTHWVGTFDTLNNPIPRAFADYLDNNLPECDDHAIYFDYGTETLDALYEPYQMKVDRILESRNCSKENWQTKKFAGENHSERAWKKRLEIPLKFLLGQGKNKDGK